jgi:Endomembrane protein 70
MILTVQGDRVLLKVNKLTSTRTQLPYEYFSLPYCQPRKIVSSAENLGEVLRGDRIETSPYEVHPFVCSTLGLTLPGRGEHDDVHTYGVATIVCCKAAASRVMVASWSCDKC